MNNVFVYDKNAFSFDKNKFNLFEIFVSMLNDGKTPICPRCGLPLLTRDMLWPNTIFEKKGIYNLFFSNSLLLIFM